MANQGNKDGWRTKGHKQLLSKDVQRACQLAQQLEKQEVQYDFKIYCGQDFELDRARQAWAGLEKNGSGLKYKNVSIIKV
jgi:hypothetical protein